MRIKHLALIAVIQLTSGHALARDFLDKVTGNYQLSKSIGAPKPGFEGIRTKNCPRDLNIAFNEYHSTLELKDRGNGQVVEVFNSINSKKLITKVDTMLWQETKTTLKRMILAKRSRLCRGAIARNCEGNFKPRTSIMSSQHNLIFNIYGIDHQLQAKCYYQRPNEVSL
jgi:ribosomal protein S17E